jgi:5-methylthioadenosine/S-adenosylhomocysteine deaminase
VKVLIQNVHLDGAITDIFIENGTITEISPSCGRSADKVIDGRNKAVLPSFINGHTHAAMTLFRGLADDMPLKSWLEDKIWKLEEKLTDDDVYWGARLACLEMIKNGITVFNDMYWRWEATAQAVRDMKVRGFISAVFIDMFDSGRAREQIDHNRELYARSKEYGPYVTFTFGPHAIYTVSRESLEWMRDFSAENDILIHMHLAETENESVFSQNTYGMSPTAFLDSLGILSERYIGCHGCMLDKNDVEILGRRGAKLVHVPVSNLKLAVEKDFPYSLVQEARIPFCFGTDGCASNNHLDIIETMKFASLLAKFCSSDPTMLPARQTFDIATQAAADIFRLGKWVIEEGSSPDIVLIDLKRPEFVPNFEMYSDIVYATNGSAVDTVICRGEVLMEGRIVPGEEEIMARAAEAARSLVRR